MIQAPVVYSFRRCPYAMRARLALWQSGITFELREVVLKDKPQEMIELSPKGTVPVLVLNDSAMAEVSDLPTIIDESLDIMLWALTKKDPNVWLPLTQEKMDECLNLIDYNDTVFKAWLDKYKYFDRFPEHSQSYYRSNAEEFVSELDTMLDNQSFLSGDQFGFLDAALAPFIRQFAHVDLAWFQSSGYKNVIAWLDAFKSSDLFIDIMQKYPKWELTDTPRLVNSSVG